MMNESDINYYWKEFCTRYEVYLSRIEEIQDLFCYNCIRLLPLGLFQTARRVWVNDNRKGSFDAYS